MLVSNSLLRGRHLLRTSRFRSINDIAETRSEGIKIARSKQLSLKPSIKIHGGSTCSGNPRGARPLSTKLPIHLVMRSSRATGEKSLLRKSTAVTIDNLVKKHAKANGVKIYRYANAGNHLHMVLKITRPELFKNFLRIISGLIARLVLKAEKGSAVLRGGKFWDARPFTRVAEWGRSFDTLCEYLELNTFEALGFIRSVKRDGKRMRRAVNFEPWAT